MSTWDIGIQTTAVNQTFAIRIGALSVNPNITVDWGNGVVETLTTNGTFLTTYASSGNYTVKISGSFESNGNIEIGTPLIPNQETKSRVKTTSVAPYIPGLVGFSFTFGKCTSLTSIPAGFFDNNPQIIDCSVCFEDCTSLTSIPSGLFDNITLLDDATGIFRGCTSLTSIPAGLFDNNTLIGNRDPNAGFRDTFLNCTSLASIPANLFNNNLLVKNFDNCFRGCTSLTSIPAGLFNNNTAVTSFVSTFENCSSLTFVPTGLFENNKDVTRFWSTFQNCISLRAVPATLFEKNTRVTDFQGCFSGVTLTTTSYSNLLINLASKPYLRRRLVNFNGGNSKYNAAGLIAKNLLSSTLGTWGAGPRHMVVRKEAEIAYKTYITTSNRIISYLITRNPLDRSPIGIEQLGTPNLPLDKIALTSNNAILYVSSMSPVNVSEVDLTTGTVNSINPGTTTFTNPNCSLKLSSTDGRLFHVYQSGTTVPSLRVAKSLNPVVAQFTPNLVWTKLRVFGTSPHNFAYSVFDPQSPTLSRVKILQTNDNAGSTSSGDTNGVLFNFYNSKTQAGVENNSFYIKRNVLATNGGSSYNDFCWSGNSNILSVVEYTGNGASPREIFHTLGTKPAWVIIKQTSGTQSWVQWLKKLPDSNYYTWTNGVVASNAEVFNSASTWSSNSVRVGNSALVNASGQSYVMLCFAEIDGFSKVGTYTPRQVTNAWGPFVHTGFTPSLVLLKRRAGASSVWNMIPENVIASSSTGIQGNSNLIRNAFNPANTSEIQEIVNSAFCSCGFKLRTTNTSFHIFNNVFDYIAFAKSPFKYSEGSIISDRLLDVLPVLS